MKSITIPGFELPVSENIPLTPLPIWNTWIFFLIECIYILPSQFSIGANTSSALSAVELSMQTNTAGAQGPGKPDQVGGIPANGRGLELVGFWGLFPPKPSYDFVILSCTQAPTNSKNPSHHC